MSGPLEGAGEEETQARLAEQRQQGAAPGGGLAPRLAVGECRQVVHLVDDQQGAVAPHLGEVQGGRRRHRLVGGDVAGEPPARIGRVVRRPHREGVAEGRSPGRIGEGLFRLEPQGIPRHDPDHPVDDARRDQLRGRDDRQQRLAAAGRHRRQDVGDARGLAAGQRADELGQAALVAAQRTGRGAHGRRESRTISGPCRSPPPL
jgi:hypothetical protein